ncbi:MAG TPA: alpha/beta fold hydrolase [Conexibacter sp.]|nr:alpha/beta fold hydrolase [Conexibacter sp.]
MSPAVTRALSLVVMSLAIGIVATAAAPALAASPGADLRLKHCTDADSRDFYARLDAGPGPNFYDTDRRARCGRLTVPLDRAGAVAGTVRLHVAVLPPKRSPVRGTIIALAGGPGQAATNRLRDWAETLGPALRARRLVAFDPRGTGRSGPLVCPSLRWRRVSAAVAACATKLGTARNSYGTAASVEDLEAVRAALGVPRIVLYGTSYGTQLALAYAAAHPDRVEALVLDSVVPPTGDDPFARSSLAAIPRVLASPCGRAGCPFSDDLGADLAAVVAQIRERGPLPARQYDRHGRPHDVRITRTQLLYLLFAGDLDPFVRSAVPAAIAAAADGDPAALARLVAPRRFADDLGGGDFTPAAYLATSCADGPAPWPAGTPLDGRAAARDAALAALPAGALDPFDAETLVADGGLDLCSAWPETPAPAAPAALPDVPALLLAGEQDLRTPLEDAQAVAAQLPRAKLLAVPAVGHSVLSFTGEQDCPTRAVRAFLAGATLRPCPSVPDNAFPLVPRPPARFAALDPVPGLPPRVGRTLAAVRATYADLEHQSVMTVIGFMGSAESDIDNPDPPTLGWGGLRGGRATEDHETLGWLVRDYEVVPGVRVSGRAPAKPDRANGSTYHLRIGGRHGAPGRLRVGPRRIVGRLGGMRIDVPTRVASAFGTARG